jgi:hypothetical protein
VECLVAWWCDSLYSQQPLKSVGKADFLRIKDLCEESIQVLGKPIFFFFRKRFRSIHTVLLWMSWLRVQSLSFTVNQWTQDITPRWLRVLLCIGSVQVEFYWALTHTFRCRLIANRASLRVDLVFVKHHSSLTRYNERNQNAASEGDENKDQKSSKILDCDPKKNGGTSTGQICLPFKHAATLPKNLLSARYELKIVNWLCRIGRPWIPAMEGWNAEGSEYCTSQFSQVQLPRSIALLRAPFNCNLQRATSNRPRHAILNTGLGVLAVNLVLLKQELACSSMELRPRR